MVGVNRINLLVATPAYGGMVHVDYVAAMLGYQAAGIPFSLMTIGNESLITRARNTLLAEFHARAEFTHLLFLDADVRLSAEGLLRLLSHERDVVGAPVALKARAASGARIFNIGPTCGEDGPLLLCSRVGTAALLLSRRAATSLVEDAKAQGLVYSRGDSSFGADKRASVHYDVFRVGVLDDEYLSEDFWACRSLRRLGYAIHVDHSIIAHHMGMVQV